LEILRDPPRDVASSPPLSASKKEITTPLPLTSACSHTVGKERARGGSRANGGGNGEGGSGPEVSLPGSSSSAAGGPAVLPTSVVARKSRIGLLHLSSAKSSEILKRSLPWPVLSLTSAHGISCWLLHCGQFLVRCCIVLAPPALRVGSARGPPEVLPRKAVSRLQLILYLTCYIQADSPMTAPFFS